MKGIKQAMLEEIYTKATEVAKQTEQTVGENHDLYINLYQLERILQTFQE